MFDNTKDIPLDDQGFEMLYTKQPSKYDFSGMNNCTIIIIEHIDTLNVDEGMVPDLTPFMEKEEGDDGDEPTEK